MAVRLIPKGDQMVPQGPESGQRKTYSITVEGRERKFHVFLPSAYDGSRRLPLLLSLHGNSGYQPERESWFYAAEREGFVVVYPEAVKEEKWNIWGLKTKSGGPDDIAYLDAVLDDMIENFAVDPDRIYMHGQSMGDNMASYYAYHRSERLAALTVTSGPVLPSVMYDQEGNLQFGPKKPLPAARTHGEKDYMCGLPSTYGISKEVIAQALTVQEQVELRHTMDSLQKEVWKTVNQTAKKPLLYFDEEKNVEIYPGKEADFLFYSIVGGVHRPALNVFDMLWQGGAKGYYRSGTQRGRDEGCPGVKPDEKAMAFAQGSDCFYSGLQVRSLKEEGISAEILVDGKDVSRVTLKSLRTMIGIVQQDVYLFCGTVKENIGYGKPGASMEEIIEAAKKANIHDFIMSLPDGYDTFVGERGTRLSGGQKQRISIARVFLKNPPILILDEATSALDNESERHIQMSLEKLSKDRTTITIAHRLSTIRNADEIIVINNEGIAERGTHRELMEQGGIYAHYYQMQFEGLEMEE